MDQAAELADMVVEHLRELAACGPPRPLRVGVDGRSAAGKTTFADRVASLAGEAGRHVIRTSIDDFHPSGHKTRHYTVETYYDFGYEYDLFRSWVLDPLAYGADRRCRLAYWDSFNDVPGPTEEFTAPDDAILIVDGAFLLRPELSSCWDLIIWLHIPFEEMVARATERDTSWVGDAEKVQCRYVEHWAPLHELYERLTGGDNRADLVIDNSKPEQPKVLRASWSIDGSRPV